MSENLKKMSYIFIKKNKKLDVLPELWGFALPHVSRNVNFFNLIILCCAFISNIN